MTRVTDLRAAGCVALATFLTLGLCQAQDKNIGGKSSDPKANVEVKGHKSRGEANAPDENIKQDRATNDPNSKLQPPPSKGGPAQRSLLCAVRVDNRTPWITSIYVDGRYRGDVDSYGDFASLAIAGGTRLYARAMFRDGTSLTWGPTVVYCPRDDVFTWKLTH